MESIFIKQGIVIRVLLEKWRNYGIIDEKMPDLGRNDLQRNAGEKKMKKILDLITAEITQAFVDCGYDAKYGKVTLSNRPDLCEYQCNGAMAGAKKYKKAPVMIAGDVAAKAEGSELLAEVAAVAPGFLNIKVKESAVSDYLKKMAESERFGLEPPAKKEKIVMDYGGPNVAKPLHV